MCVWRKSFFCISVLGSRELLHVNVSRLLAMLISIFSRICLASWCKCNEQMKKLHDRQRQRRQYALSLHKILFRNYVHHFHSALTYLYFFFSPSPSVSLFFFFVHFASIYCPMHFAFKPTFWRNPLLPNEKSGQLIETTRISCRLNYIRLNETCNF